LPVVCAWHLTERRRVRPPTRPSARPPPPERGIRRSSAVLQSSAVLRRRQCSSRFFPLLEHGHAVLAAETEAVHDDVADRQLAGFPWHVVEVTRGIWLEPVGGGRGVTRF